MKTAALIVVTTASVLLLAGSWVGQRTRAVERQLEERSRRALVLGGVPSRVSVSGRRVMLEGSEAFGDSARALVEGVEGVGDVTFELSDHPPPAVLRLDMRTSPIRLSGSVPNEGVRADLLADVQAVFPDTPVALDVAVADVEDPRGWPSTFVPLFSTVRDRAPGARLDVVDGYVVLAGVDWSEAPDGFAARILGSAPGLALELAYGHPIESSSPQ